MVLDVFKRIVREEVVYTVTVDGKIADKDLEVAYRINTAIDEANDFLAVMDILKEENFLDEADLFRVLVDAIEEEGV